MPRHPLHPFPDRANGLALVAVLGLVSLLAILALIVLDATRRHGQILERSMESAQERELVDGALRVAMLEWSSASSRTTQDLASSRRIELFGTAVDVRLDVESGRIDLNAADELLLVAILAGNDYEAAAARRLARRIVDWRDADDVGDSGGSERDEYRAAETPGPRNGPFETVQELRSVLGLQSIDPELLDAFTVYTRAASVRPEFAPPAVRNALRWADRERLGGRTWESSVDDSARSIASLAGEVVRLQGCAVAGSVRRCRRAIVRFTGNVRDPWMVFAWESVERSVTKASAEASLRSNPERGS